MRIYIRSGRNLESREYRLRLNGHRSHYIISLFKVTYKSAIQISRDFHALFTKTLEKFRYLRLMRASVFGQSQHAHFSEYLVAEVSSLCISSVCLITLDFPQPNREIAC